MPPIEHQDARECTTKALEGIADFTGDIEKFTFEHWHDFHKSIFINLVAACIRKKGSRIVINEGMLGQFTDIAKFIDYLHQNSVYLGEPPGDLHESDGDLKP